MSCYHTIKSLGYLKWYKKPSLCLVAGVLWVASVPATAETASRAEQYILLQDVLILGESPMKPSQIKPYFKPLIGKQITPSLLEQLRLVIAQAYDENGLGLTSVATPFVSSQTAVVRVEPITLSNIKTSVAETQQAITDLDATKVLPALKINLSPDLKKLDTQLRLAQMQPHRRWEIDFRQDDEPQPDSINGTATQTPQAGFSSQAGGSLSRSMEQAGQAKAVTKKPKASKPQSQLLANILVSDESPWYGRMILDNAGQKATGLERLRVQVGHGDLFGPGRSLDLTMLGAAKNPNNQYQFALRYQHPLPALATLFSAEAWYARSNSGLQAGFFDVSSNSQGYSVSARHLLPRKGSLEPFVEISAESGKFDNVIDFFGINIGNKVGIAPLSITAGGQYTTGDSRLYSQLRWRHNEGWGNNASQAEYEAARSGASPYWNTYDGLLEWRTALSKNREVVIRLQGQYSPDALVAPAQFRVGGSQSMRGLQEGELAGDYGTSLSLEHWWLLNHHHQVSAWLDMAEAHRHKVLSGEVDNASAVSGGLSWQWQIVKGTSLNTTAAKVLSADDLGVTTSKDYRIQFTLNWSF